MVDNKNGKCGKAVDLCGIVHHAVVYKKKMSDSEEEVFLTLRQSSFGGSFGASTLTDFLCQSSDDKLH